MLKNVGFTNLCFVGSWPNQLFRRSKARHNLLMSSK